MTTLRSNFKWPQGEDLKIQLTYKEGSATNAKAVDLSGGYSVRMDLVVPRTTTVLYTVNSDSSEGNPVEVTLGAGPANIVIDLPRSLTLPDGALYEKMVGTPPLNSFNYDLFLRNTVTDKQVKILMGTITVEASSTLWT